MADTTDRFDSDVETAQLVREIVQHHVAMEQQLSPVIVRAVPEGERIADGQFVEHRALADELRGLEDQDPVTAAFTKALAWHPRPLAGERGLPGV